MQTSLEPGTDEFVAWWKTLDDARRAGWMLADGAEAQIVWRMYPDYARSIGVDIDRILRTCDRCGHDPGAPAPVLQLVPDIPTESPTLEAWRDWRTWLRGRGMSPVTIRCYSGNVLRLLAESGCRPLREYDDQDLAAFLGEWARGGQGRYSYCNAIRSFFGWALRRHLVDVDPSEDLVSRKPRKIPPVTLTYDELARLLVASRFVNGERATWVILLMYALGLRRMEAAGLKWEHIRDGESGPVIEIHQTKGANERPALPLSPLALECLARLREIPAGRPDGRGRKPTYGPEYIAQVKDQSVSMWVYRAGTAAGLPPKKRGSHRLRASIATHLLRQGVDVVTVQNFLGHLRLDSTAWYLAYAEEGEIRTAVNGALERLGASGLTRPDALRRVMASRPE